jgi:hypothetical protein
VGIVVTLVVVNENMIILKMEESTYRFNMSRIKGHVNGQIELKRIQWDRRIRHTVRACQSSMQRRNRTYFMMPLRSGRSEIELAV